MHPPQITRSPRRAAVRAPIRITLHERAALRHTTWNIMEVGLTSYGAVPEAGIRIQIGTVARPGADCDPGRWGRQTWAWSAQPTGWRPLLQASIAPGPLLAGRITHGTDFTRRADTQ